MPNKSHNAIIVILLVIAPLWYSVSKIHKFYVSVTQIDYVAEKQSVQIITRVFLDDLEDALSARSGEAIRIPADEKNTQFDVQIKEYLSSKIQVSINGKAAKINFIGKSLDLDMMIVYLEIPKVESIKSINIQNSMLIELFEEQQNIIRTNINQIKKSFILIAQERSRMLNF